MDAAWVSDGPEPGPKVTEYAVEVCSCQKCGKLVRGEHDDLAGDQYGGTAHRLSEGVVAQAHAMHYGMGIPVRKVPAVLRQLTGVLVTQSALTQVALRRAGGKVGAAYQEACAGMKLAPRVHTDDTSWTVGGDRAQLMTLSSAKDALEEVVEVVRPMGAIVPVAVYVPDVGNVLLLQVRVNPLADADEPVLVAAGEPEQL